MSDFETREIADLAAVGRTDSDGVRFWIRTLHPGEHRVAIWTADEQHVGTVTIDPPPGADGTTSVRYPDDVAGGRPLTPATGYLYRIEGPAGLIAEGRFDTAPRGAADAPAHFSFAILSCNQPFDDGGRLDPPSLATLEIAERALRAHDVKRVLLIGDQMYADYPPKLSLFDDGFFQKVAPPGRQSIFECTREEVRALYQRRYRAFWSIDRFREVLSSYPCAAIMDDHEIRDNFGADPEHGTSKWAAIRDGALDAFHDYQGLLLRPREATRPRCFDYELHYADVSVYALDLRSQRSHDGVRLELCSDAQLDELAAFLARSAGQQLVMVVLSVPLMIFPSWLVEKAVEVMGEGSDAADRWTNPKAADCRQRLTQILHDHQRAHPEQRLLLIGGDIHVGCVVQFRWRDQALRPMYQLVTSAVSNLADYLTRRASAIAPTLEQHLDGPDDEPWARVELVEGAGENPYDNLNLGIVELDRRPDGTLGVTLKLVGDDRARDPQAKIVFSVEMP